MLTSVTSACILTTVIFPPKIRTDMVVMQLSGKGKKINERRVRMRVKEKRDKKDKNISSIQLYFN